MVNEKSTTGHAVVIGAGVMGAGIAALLANVGWRVSLLDRLPDDAGTGPKSRNRLAQEGLDRVLKSRPAQFALPEYARRVRVGNVEDHLAWLADADWVVEAVAEDPDVKSALLKEIAGRVETETVITSNTSGLSLAGMVADCPPDFRARFLGTHFFNPPRYMKPVELIPQEDTDPAVFEGFVQFADRVLGKRVTKAKDTPGFISTRLGMYALSKTIQIAVRRGMTVEEVDYLTGPLLGRPKSGTFRLADVVGLDITARIRDNLAAALPHDATYQALVAPDVMRRLISEGRIGAKSGAGFYRREKSGEILSLDLKTGEYRPRVESKPAPKEIEGLPLGERLRKLWEMSPELDGGFLREVFITSLGYMADVTPEVADRIVEVDDALIGGFGWEIGPFHALDALGEIDWPDGPPALVRRRAEAGQPRFYTSEAGAHSYFDFASGRMADLPRPHDVIILKDVKKAGRVVEETPTASMVDLGAGALCVEWRTKMNTLDPALIGFVDRARERAEREFSALVVGGAGEHFSAGFNLKLFASQIESQDWAAAEQALSEFQQTLQRLKYARIPVVAAVSGYTLGGGCEMMLHAVGVQAAFESAIGLPEANVGLIPAGGGTTQTFLRAMQSVPDGTLLEPADPFPALKPIWDLLCAGRFSASAPEAREIGYLREEDGITMHPDRLLFDAKERALSLAGSHAPSASQPVVAMGENGLARFQWELLVLRRSGQISAHDALVAEKLAWILCGGSLRHRAGVTEQYLLDLEREAFLSLAGTPETLARIQHMLATGKPLRN